MPIRWGLFFSILLTGSPGPAEWRLLNDGSTFFLRGVEREASLVRPVIFTKAYFSLFPLSERAPLSNPTRECGVAPTLTDTASVRARMTCDECRPHHGGGRWPRATGTVQGAPTPAALRRAGHLARRLAPAAMQAPALTAAAPRADSACATCPTTYRTER